VKPSHGPSADERRERTAAERIYGLAAARAAFATRPEAVISIAYTEELRHPLADMLRNAARRRIAYREVPADELTHMAQSVHHEGVCLLARPRAAPTSSTLLQGLGARGLVLALDGVQNPHNIGAILRSAAYFGARGLVYTDGAAHKQQKPALAAAARRVAEGGAEYVPVLRVAALPSLLRDAARADVRIVGTDAHAHTSAAKFRWPARTLLVLGHEQRGLTREVRAACQELVRIPGSDRLDSLNVSVAAGILLAQYASAHGASSADDEGHGRA